MADSQQLSSGRAQGSPYDLGHDDAYRHWRDSKLDGYPANIADLVVEVRDPMGLTAAERTELVRRCRKTNLVIYQFAKGMADKAAVRRLGAQLGLHRLDDNLCADEDSVTSLKVMGEGTRHEGYIPYSNRPLSWHTDGYYNTAEHRIRALVLHCASSAARGGENALMDHEIAYLLMRDENPAYIEALMQPDAMTIPANVENGVEIRPAQTGPVFFVDPDTGCLYMRYTARKRNIEWKDDPTTQAAVRFLERLLTGDSQYIIRHRLEAGQGLVSNNALHNRSGFEDDPAGGQTRLLYRARYYDRVAGTELGA